MRAIHFAAGLLLLALAALASGCGGGEDHGTGADRKDVIQFPAAVYEFPGSTWLALAGKGPYSGFESTLLRLVDHLREKGIEPQGELAGVFFDDPSEVDPADARYEIRVQVPEWTKAEPPFVLVKTETENHAMVRLVGPWEKIRTHYWKLYEWLDQEGYVAAGPLWEIYLEHPGTGAKPTEYDTEVHVPVKRKE